jgi:hypothetical protein
MKKLFSLLCMASLLITQAFTPSESANTATKLGTIPVYLSGQRYDADMMLMSYDTINTDLLIEAPIATGNTVCSAGMFLSDPNAQTLSFKLDGTNYLSLNLTNNQGLFDKMTSGVSVCSVPGQSLKVKSSGTFGSMLMYIIQGPSIRFGGR